MRGQPAKVLSKTDIRATIAAATRLRYPDRNRVMVLLSVRAGLRACEIAGLTWTMVLDARGSVGACIELPAKIAKNGSGRCIPLHPQLRSALLRLRRVSEGDGSVVRSERGGSMSAKAVVNGFARLYANRPSRLLVAFRSPHLCH